MKVAMISAVATFLVVLLVMIESSVVKASADVWPAEVDIQNHVGAPIRVHCDTREGTHDQSLTDGQNYGWGFTPSKWGTTNYKCSFKWGAKTREFIVWVDDFVFVRIPKRPCTHCVWSVTKLGFYRSEFGAAAAVLIHKWW